MANEVYANGMELACKAGAGKTICAMPDVCFTPPENPATPPGVPVPYPNTGFASDTSDGSKTVQISGKEIMLKNKSYFKKSTGDEAGATAKKGVISSRNTGKVYFIKWSMDVKFEGENVDRHLDMTTNNHGSPTANEGLPWSYIDSVAKATGSKCKNDAEKVKTDCREPDGSRLVVVKTPAGNDQMQRECSDDCKKAMQCTLVPKGKDKVACCKPSNTGHHMIEDHWVKDNPAFSLEQQHYYNAPCVCVEGGRTEKTHGIMHGIQGVYEDSFLPAKGNRPAGINYGKTWDYAKGKKASLRAHDMAFPNKNCTSGCLAEQIDSHYGKDSTPSRPLGQSDNQQGIGEDREAYEAYIQVTYGGPKL